MFSTLRAFLIVAVVGGGAILCSPEAEKAAANDNYWTNYWRWYDNDYRPYYNRRFRNNNFDAFGYTGFSGYNGYRYNSPYNAYYDGYRGNLYRGYDPYLGNRYSNSPYVNRYYAPYPRRNSISLGDFQFSWR